MNNNNKFNGNCIYIGSLCGTVHIYRSTYRIDSATAILVLDTSISEDGPVALELSINVPECLDELINENCFFIDMGKWGEVRNDYLFTGIFKAVGKLRDVECGKIEIWEILPTKPHVMKERRMV